MPHDSWYKQRNSENNGGPQHPRIPPLLNVPPIIPQSPKRHGNVEDVPEDEGSQECAYYFFLERWLGG